MTGEVQACAVSQTVRGLAQGIRAEELLADLRRVAKMPLLSREGCVSFTMTGEKWGKSPSVRRIQGVTRKEYDKYGKYKHKRFLARFGSWLNALEAAGLEKTRHYNVTVEELFKNLRKVWVRLGRQPRFMEMKKPLSLFRGKAYLEMFGTWRRSCEEFIEYSSGKRKQPRLSLFDKGGLRRRKRKFRRSMDLKLRWDVMKRDHYRCRACGRSPATRRGVHLEIDHILPFSKGGKTVKENLQTLCRDCNAGKGNQVG
jgi:hypothetical protein